MSNRLNLRARFEVGESRFMMVKHGLNCSTFLEVALKKSSRFLILLWSLVSFSFFLFHNATSTSSPPVALSPAGYVTAVADFQWQADPNATAYHFLLTQSNTGQKAYEAFNFPGTSLTLPNTVTLNPNVKYTWTVQSQYSATDFSAWSNFWDFMIIDPAFVPTLQQPASYITNLRPLFAWSGVQGAISYDFELTETDSQTLVESANGIFTPNYNLVEATLSYNVGYTWRVRATDSAGNSGKWSDPIDFLVYDQLQVPTTLAPKAYVPDLNPTFKWSPVAGAVSYQIQLMNQQTSAILLDTTTTETSIAHQVDLNTVYYWRVRVLSSNATGHWSGWESFQVYDAGFAPIAAAPSGETISLTPTFSWNMISGAVAYEIEVFAGSQVIYQASSNTNSVDFLNGFTLSDRTSYTWRVRAVKAQPQVSAWSPLMAFNTVDASSIPTPVGPIQATLSTKPSFVWKRVKRASAYLIEATEGKKKVMFSQKVSGSTTVFQIPEDLDNYGVYHWRVRALASDGFAYPWSRKIKFNVFVDIGRTPPTGLTGSSGGKSVALNWKPLLGAKRYILTLQPNGKGKPVQIKSPDTTLSLGPKDVDSGVRYTVTVVGVDSRGIRSPASTPFTFTAGNGSLLSSK